MLVLLQIWLGHWGVVIRLDRETLRPRRLTEHGPCCRNPSAVGLWTAARVPCLLRWLSRCRTTDAWARGKLRWFQIYQLMTHFVEIGFSVS
jgi:hypothetical protein